MRNVMLKKENMSGWKLLNVGIVIGVLFIVAMLSPLVVDDYYFSHLQFKTFFEQMNYVLHYGNGRILGNLLVLYMLQIPLMRYFVKVISFFLIGLFMTKIVNSITKKNTKNVLPCALLLLIALIPQTFAQVYSWTSGFCNYVIPVLGCVYLIYKFIFSPKKMEWKDSISVFLIGVGGELFVEHSALINFTVVCCILVYCIKRKENFKSALFCWMGTFIGLVVIFLEPHFFTISTEFENYQKLNIGNLHDLIISVVSNAMQICQEYTGAVVLWGILSFSLMKNYKRQINFMFRVILSIFPMYSGIYYMIMRLNIFSNSIFMGIINAIIVLVYLLTILCTIIKIPDKEIRFISVMLEVISVYSVLPLLVVYPIGERCLFHSYIMMAMLALVNYANINCKDIKIYNYIVTGMTFCMLLVLLGSYCRLHKVDIEKNVHIMKCMKNGDTEIDIPQINSDYIHSSANIMIEDAFFYNKPGDISFFNMEYSKWVQKYEN